MNLFNQFRETVFLKEDSNLETQLGQLKEIREKIANKDQIDRDIKFLEIGLQGEKEIAYELRKANIGMYVLHDITLTFENLKAQIDYIIITKGYCYLVECKNLIGNITVNSSGQFKREYYFNKNIVKEAIYSPYTQAVNHKEILKKRWLSKNNKIITFFREANFDNLWFKPLVVLCNSQSLLNVKYAPKEIKNSTIRVDNLVEYIKQDLRKYDHDCFSSKKNMLELANSFLEGNISNTSSNLVEKYKKVLFKEQSLKNKLKEFRTTKSSIMNIPAYYIFSDEELNNLILKQPKTFEQLKAMNILSDIKLKLHGKEILKIINECFYS